MRVLSLQTLLCIGTNAKLRALFPFSPSTTEYPQEYVSNVCITLTVTLRSGDVNVEEPASPCPLGLARDLQLDLEKIADKADTSSPDGLHYVLEETVLALLRNPEYCVYGFATTNSAKGPEEAEDLFNEMSMVGCNGGDVMPRGATQRSVVEL